MQDCCFFNEHLNFEKQQALTEFCSNSFLCVIQHYVKMSERNKCPIPRLQTLYTNDFLFFYFFKKKGIR